LKSFRLLFASLVLFSCEKRGAPSEESAERGAPERVEGLSYAIAPRIVRDDGVFELVTLIEGAKSNQEFISNFRVVRAQREKLLQHGSENTPAQSPDRGEDYEALGTKFRDNVELMKTAYGYDLKHQFLYLPFESVLHEVRGDDKVPVKRLLSPDSYDRLQELRRKYSEAVESSSADSSSALALADVLRVEFGFDVQKNYLLDVERGGLYRSLKIPSSE
jgi:hypothetical protein